MNKLVSKIDGVSFLFKNKIRNSIWWNSRLAKKIIPRSEFAKNVAVLSGGTAIAQGIGILTIPIFSRLYSPRDFGIMALFMGISGIIRVIASGRYEIAVLLPRKDEEAANLTMLGSLISLVVGGVSLIVILFLSGPIAGLLGESRISGLLIFIPLDIVLFGVCNPLSYWSNRKKLYKIMSTESIGRALVQGVLRFVLYFLIPNERGLIYSYMGGRVASFVILLIGSSKSLSYEMFNIGVMKRVARKYIKFPTFSVLSALTNNLSRQLTSITMPKLFGIQILGYYSQAVSVMGLPLQLLSGSMGKVFFQEASKEKMDTGAAKKTFDRTLKRLTLVSLPLFGLVFMFVRPAVTIFLGERWSSAGKYAQILVPLYAIRFVSSALSPSVAVSGKMSLAFIRDSLLCLGAVSAMIAVFVFNLSLIQYLMFINLVLGLQYLGAILVYKKLSVLKYSG